jgi:hypothetical protein
MDAHEGTIYNGRHCISGSERLCRPCFRLAIGSALGVYVVLVFALRLGLAIGAYVVSVFALRLGLALGAYVIPVFALRLDVPSECDVTGKLFVVN